MGIELPTVEIRFENIHIETALYTDTGRNLPTILNSYRAALEVRPSNAIRTLHRAGPVQSTVLGHIDRPFATHLLGQPDPLTLHRFMNPHSSNGRYGQTLHFIYLLMRSSVSAS